MPDPIESAPQRQTSRGKVSRIDRSYFHRPNRFQIARRWLILAGLALGIAWCAWGAFDAPLHHAPGPVAAVHAKWESDCNACHVPFSPIKDNTWLSTAATRQAMDGKCEACHRGPAHHPLQVAAEVGSCASCHADHRGRGADISRVADRTCTACHGNITAHRIVETAVTPSAVTAPITRFDSEHHPAFAGLASDPGRLKFSHGRHMRAGLTFGPQTTGTASARAWTYGMLAAADRGRYQPAAAAEHDLVQLSCASCHEFGSSLPPDAVRTLPAALAAAPPGAYALPVEFDRHCAACHQLPFEGLAGEPRAASGSGDSQDDLVMVTPDAVLPHGLDAAGMARFLESRYLKDALAGDASPLEEPLVRRPLPAARPTEAAGPRVRSLVETQVKRALTFARGTCEKCHETLSAPLAAAAHMLPGAGTEAQPAWFAVAPTNVPSIWLTKARFDHRPHRAYDCRECHAAAAPEETAEAGSSRLSQAATPPVGSPLDNGIVMIAGRESCTACHAPAAHDPATGKPVGGARFDCVECHGYHGLGPHQALTGVSPVADAAGARRGGATDGLPH
jgi:hypothetical protein